MRKLFLLPVLAVLTLPLFAQAAATPIGDTTGLNSTVKEALGPDATSTEAGNLPMFIGDFIVKPILGLVGLIFFILMLYAGILWMTAGGNSDQVKKAKQILVNGIVGIVIITAAYAITQTVLNAVTVA